MSSHASGAILLGFNNKTTQSILSSVVQPIGEWPVKCGFDFKYFKNGPLKTKLDDSNLIHTFLFKTTQ